MEFIFPLCVFIFLCFMMYLFVDTLYPYEEDNIKIGNFNKKSFMREIELLYKRKPYPQEIHKILKVMQLYKEEYGAYPPPEDLERIILKYKNSVLRN